MYSEWEDMLWRVDCITTYRKYYLAWCLLWYLMHADVSLLFPVADITN
jgi:hypothetical protein